MLGCLLTAYHSKKKKRTSLQVYNLTNTFWFITSVFKAHVCHELKLRINLHRAICRSICSYLHGKCSFDPRRALKVKYFSVSCCLRRTRLLRFVSGSEKPQKLDFLCPYKSEWHIEAVVNPNPNVPSLPFDPKHCGIVNWQRDALPDDELSSKSRLMFGQQCRSASGKPL